MSKESYSRGFVKAATSAGVDPAMLAKLAGFTDLIRSDDAESVTKGQKEQAKQYFHPARYVRGADGKLTWQNGSYQSTPYKPPSTVQTSGGKYFHPARYVRGADGKLTWQNGSYQSTPYKAPKPEPEKPKGNFVAGRYVKGPDGSYTWQNGYYE